MNRNLHLRTAVRATPRVAALFLCFLAFALPSIGACAAQETTVRALSHQAQREVIARAADVLRDRYVFPDVAARVAVSLREAEGRGEFAEFSDPEAFARALSAHIRNASRDAHLWVAAQPGEFPEPRREVAPGASEEQRRALARSNFGFPRVEILPGNVGYLRIHQFVRPELGGEAASAAMRFLAHSDALILDLRESMGGSPDMVVLLASYLFEGEPVHLFDVYHRPEDRREQHRTYRYVPGARMPDQPVYVLTRASTFSAGEGLAYVLRHLNRVTVVGETTAGGAHPGRYHRLSSDLVMFVAEARVTSPITGDNWEGRGVVPDVMVPAERALDTAHLLALEALLEKQPDGEIAAEYERAAREIRARLDTEPGSRR